MAGLPANHVNMSQVSANLAVHDNDRQGGQPCGSQAAVHDVQADEAVLRVIEGLRYGADHLEPE
jgi:hypothetical protein